MEYQNPKIELYKQRSFSEKVSATFAFIAENYKPLLKYLFLFMLPCGLLMAIGTGLLTSIMPQQATINSDINEGLLFQMGKSYSILMFVGTISSILCVSLVYALMTIYNKREQRLQNITFDDIKPIFMHNIAKSIKFVLMCFAITVIAIALVATTYFIHIAVGILFTIAILVVFMPIQLVMSIYMLEDTTLKKAFTRGIRLGLKTWGSLFILLFVIILLAGIIQGILMIPWYITVILEAIGQANSTTDFSFTQAGWFKAVAYLFNVIQSIGNLIIMALPIIAVSYHYGHVCDKYEGAAVEQDIDKFETL